MTIDRTECSSLVDDRPWDETFRSRLLRQGLSNDEMAQAVEVAEAAWRRAKRLHAALEDLLDVSERWIGGDRSLDPERWYASRDFARIELRDAP